MSRVPPPASPACRATQSEAEFLRDRAVVRGMVQQVGADKLSPQLAHRRFFGLLSPEPEQDQIETAIDLAEKSLRVVAQPDSNLIQVSFENGNRAVAMQAVDALIDVYLKRRAEIFNNLRSPFLREKAKSYADQLSQIEDQLEAERKRYHVINLDQEITLALNQYDGTLQRRQRQVEQRASLVAEIATTEHSLQTLPKQVFDYVERNNHFERDETSTQLTKLYLERDKLKALYQDGEPQLADVERQIKVLEKVEREPKTEPPTTREVRNPTLDFLNNHLDELKIEAASVASSITELDRQTTEARRRVDELRTAERSLRGLERSHAIIDQLYRETNQRAEATEIEEAAAAVKTANIQILEHADASLRGTTNRTNLALAILVGGVMLSAALTLFAAWNRRIFLLPQEVARSLHMPVLATFTDGEPFDSPDATTQIIYLAGQLAFGSDQGPRTQKIQIISAGPAEQRAEFAAALATELAKGQSRRTLLLDLAGDGISHWSQLGSRPPRRKAGVHLTIAETDVKRLDVSVGAPTGEVNWQRANGEDLEQLFDALGDAYEIILVDAPAPRDSLVGLRLAGIVDGSILTVRCEHTRAPVASHLASQLLGAGGDLFGAVVTGRRFHIPKVIYRWF
jgi:Mrp family chromosome partitioning ATPase